MVKIAPDELIASRQGLSPDPKTQAGLTFALALFATRGHVSDTSLAEVRAAGFSDGEIGEIVAHVALNVFTNSFKSTAQTDVDFPAAPVLRRP